MDTVKMIKAELKVLAMKIEHVLNSETELNIDVICALTKTRSGISNEIDAIDEMLKALAKEEQKLTVKYCDKDADGEPIIIEYRDKDANGVSFVRDSRYCGLEPGKHSEFDNGIEEISNKRRAFLKEELDVTMHYIDKEKIPQKGKAQILEALTFFIKD